MVVTASAIEPQPIRAKDGQPFAYFVPAEEWSRMQSEIASLREQLATAIRERDHHLAHLVNALKTRFPPPPTEEEMRAAVDNTHVVDAIIAALESPPSS